MRYPTESMGGYGAVRHEILGADYLRRLGFSERIAQLVENHVQAKRYLTWKYPEYLASLSEASLQTLRFQGGPMQKQEAEAFENNPLFADSLLMRRWDEQAKVMHLPEPSAALWQEMALRHLQMQQSKA
jgi:predicted HD phosphohydrolase